MGLQAFVESVPDYEVRDGRIYIGVSGISLVMSIRTFMDSIARAEAEIAKWHLKCLSEPGCEVIPFPKRSH